MYNTSKTKYFITLGLVVFLILAAIFYSLISGTFEMSFMDVIRTILRIEADPNNDLVIFDFRLPRILIACLVGVSLGIAGAVVQGVTKNGLADPGILGINAGAGAAVVLFMFLFYHLFFYMSM